MPELNSANFTLRNEINAWATNEVKHNRKPSYWNAEKKFNSKQSKRLNKAKFFNKLYPEGIRELWREAGYEEKPEDSNRYFGANRSLEIEPIRISEKEKFKEVLRKYEEATENLSYQARSDPKKTLEFAKKVLPSQLGKVWDRFVFMSNGQLDITFQEAIDMAGGPYILMIRREIESRKTPEDSDERFLTWLKDIVRARLNAMVSQKRGMKLSPGIADGICRACNSRLYLTSEDKIRCMKCEENVRWTCRACSCKSMTAPNISRLSCSDCGYQRIFDPPLRTTSRSEGVEEVIDLRTTRRDRILDGYGYVLYEQDVPVMFKSFREIGHRRLS